MAKIHVEGMDLNQKPCVIDCEVCVEAKQFKATCTGSIAKEKEDHVFHSDIIGLIQPFLIGKSTDILTFIVERSIFKKAYILKSRSEVYKQLKEFKAWLERATSLTVKRFHSDQVKEYISLGDMLKKERIVQTFSTSHTPQSNGLAERYNKTLLSKTRAMLFDSGLESQFWREASFHVCYVSNVISTSASNGRAPYEALFERKTDVSRLRIFGCQARAHSPKEVRTGKFDARSRPGIFVEIINGLYKVWKMQTKRLVVSKNVVFDEK